MRKVSLLMILAVGLWSCGGHSHEEGHEGHEHGEKKEEAAGSEKADDHAGHDHGDHDGHDHGETKETLAAVALKKGQKVFFISPEMDETVSSPVTVKMGVEGMEVEPAGYVNEDKGHHHLLINQAYIEAGKLIEQGNPKIIHYGKGETEAELDLEPGLYKLTLQFANGAHESYGIQMSSTIVLNVK